jgi:hypothetical protein
LDIKPYLPEVEALPNARTGWPVEVQKDPIDVEFSEHAENLLQNWSKQNPDKALREIIIETIQQDPRPVVYRGFENEEESPYRSSHAVRIFDGDIHFKFESPLLARVFDIHFKHN